MLDERTELVDGRAGLLRQREDGVVPRDERGLGRVAAPVVEAPDPDGGEPVGQPLDLAEEVGGGEAPLPQGVRRRVGGRPDAGAALHELAEQPRHEHRVARVVELELVDRDEGRAGQQADGLRVAERADEGRVLDEGAEVLAPGREVPERREQMGLADAEPAVEVEAGPLGRLRPAAEEAAGPRSPAGREGADRLHRLRLRRVLRVGPVVLEPGLRELPGRRQRGGHPGGVDLRHEVREAPVGGHERHAASQKRARGTVVTPRA